METNQASPNVVALGLNEVRERIETLDFSMIRGKMADPRFKGWSAAKLDFIERQYRNYLFLWSKYGADIPPSEDIDEFWHYHILDTRRYHVDCERVFGQYLHHFPYFGIRGADDASNLERAFMHARELYRREFGEDVYEYEDDEPADAALP